MGSEMCIRDSPRSSIRLVKQWDVNSKKQEPTAVTPTTPPRTPVIGLPRKPMAETPRPDKLELTAPKERNLQAPNYGFPGIGASSADLPGTPTVVRTSPTTGEELVLPMISGGADPHIGRGENPGSQATEDTVQGAARIIEHSTGSVTTAPGDQDPADDQASPGLIVCRILIPRSCSYCLLYTSPSPRDLSTSRMPSSA